MEELDAKQELMARLGDIIGDVKLANALVSEGKEVHCDRKLQGVRTKLLYLFENLKRLPDDTKLAPEIKQ